MNTASEIMSNISPGKEMFQVKILLLTSLMMIIQLRVLMEKQGQSLKSKEDIQRIKEQYFIKSPDAENVSSVCIARDGKKEKPKTSKYSK